MCSPWQWFCSTRTLSNCVETTYTVVALESWPWRWTLGFEDKETLDAITPEEEADTKTTSNKNLQEEKDEVTAKEDHPQKEERKAFLDETSK